MAAKPQDTYALAAPFTSGEQSVLILTANNVQDLEFFYPYYRFAEAGLKVDVATPDGGAFTGKQGMGLQETKAIADIDENEYDLLYIPGGKAPAELVKNKDAIALTKRFAQAGKMIAAICHGPQLLAASQLVQGHKIAAWPEVEKEITQAGGTYVDQQTVIDGQFITARWPADLPAHLMHTLKELRMREPRMERRASGKAA